MDGLLDFLANNYVYFMVGAILLLFALIGFIFGGKRKQKKEESLQGAAPAANTVMPDPAPAVTPETTVETVQEQPTLEQAEAPTLNFDAQAPAEPASIFDMPQENVEPTIAEPINVSSETTIGEPISMDEPIAVEPVVETVEAVVEPIVEEPVVEVPTEPIVEPVVEETIVEAPVETITEPVVEPIAAEPVVEDPISEPITSEVPVEPTVETSATPVVEPVAEIPAVETTEEQTTPLA